MVGSSSSEDREQQWRGGFAGHHKPTRSRQPGVQGSKGPRVSARPATDPQAAQEKRVSSRKALEVMSNVEGDALRAQVEEGSKRRSGASIGCSDGAVRILHLQIAATFGRGLTNNAVDRRQSLVGEVAIGGRVSRSIFCNTKYRQRV